MTNEAAPQTPVHIGYIVDGNRRWAKKHGLPAYEGHLAGYNALKDVALETLNQGVRYMSAYIFSTENWKRSSDEVQRLMGLTLRLVKADLPLFHQHNVRMRFIGSRENVDPKLVKAIEHAEAETAANTGGDLILCFNYGGQLEITDAVKKIVQLGISAEDITEDVVAGHLYAPDVPPVDLVVRTSGEERLSNFMLWRAAYSEFMFLQKPWPEMTKDDVGIIMKEYAKRQRRFGS
jgi:undecaprenyl diphosphate synthase